MYMQRCHGHATPKPPHTHELTTTAMFAKALGCLELVGSPVAKSLEAGSRWAPFLDQKTQRRAEERIKTVPLQKGNARR